MADQRNAVVLPARWGVAKTLRDRRTALAVVVQRRKLAHDRRIQERRDVGSAETGLREVDECERDLVSSQSWKWIPSGRRGRRGLPSKVTGCKVPRYRHVWQDEDEGRAASHITRRTLHEARTSTFLEFGTSACFPPTPASTGCLYLCAQVSRAPADLCFLCLIERPSYRDNEKATGGGSWYSTAIPRDPTVPRERDSDTDRIITPIRRREQRRENWFLQIWSPDRF